MPAPARHATLTPPLAAVLQGYRQGAFLMADPRTDHNPNTTAPPAWYESDPRGIIQIDPPAYHIPRRLARTLRSPRFEVTSDAAFSRVIRACADPRRKGSWIDQHIIAIFDALHHAGLAHSVEAWLPWQDEKPPHHTPDDAILFDHTSRRTLVGGLYGLSIGSIYCGEAMFSRPDLGGRDASKVCLARTILHLRANEFTILDTQMHSHHLAQFGCEKMPATTYRQLLEQHRDDNRRWSTPLAPPNR